MVPHMLTWAVHAMQVEGNLVKWERWHIRTSFNYREGLVLHNVGCARLASLPSA